MRVEIDEDVKTVAEFMQKKLPASRLVSVASAVAALAPILWGRHSRDDVVALSLKDGSVSERGELPLPPAASGSPPAYREGVGDGLVEAGAVLR
jgi:hypothetical protein